MHNSNIDSPLFIADNLALDFINTLYKLNGIEIDLLMSDQSIIDWLDNAKILPLKYKFPPKELSEIAKSLRVIIREIVENLIKNEIPDFEKFNNLLELSQPIRHIQWSDNDHKFELIKIEKEITSYVLLEPVIQSVVQLITDKNLEHLKQCEASDCILYFYDSTKSHRRRWCSMSTCGNRVKAAAFRARKKPKESAKA